ncbi:AAA family ATPase, partial [Thermodesulfobacteriota bacterium]
MTHAVETVETIKIKNYKIQDKLHESQGYILYRGYRETDNATVIIKVPSEEYPNLKYIAMLRNEYEITRKLNVRKIIKPQALLKFKKGVILVLEDFDGQPLRSLIKTKIVSIEDFLSIAISLSEILSELHRKDIIHKDINPDHIFINSRTNQVKLTGFGTASILPRENLRIQNPKLIEGTLAYISPEQTGRMNRTLDYRTDFYSIGITFYEMLTCDLPFQTSDPLEMVHSHMAVEPVPPHVINSAIPRIVSKLIMKLMAKSVEERYQSGLGLKADLVECKRSMGDGGKINDFPLGRMDISERFEINQSIYGRGEEKKILIRAFNKVCEGKRGIVVVSGYIGIGKTSLVNELSKSVSNRKGFFITGKFDQFNRHNPYHGIISALQGLIRNILTEHIVYHSEYKKKLLSALEHKGQIIIDVIPEVELILGPQPPVKELCTIESQNRFNSVFRKFIRVFFSKDHPLVIFLDDIQLIDNPSLQLIQYLMNDKRTQYVLLIVAYRDNEVNSSHPLMKSLSSLQKEKVPLTQIALGPLSMKCISHLITDTLHNNGQSVKLLAELIGQKTKGNPFFMKQFLTTLYQKRLLVFDNEERIWKWEMDNIWALDVTDNVVDLLIGRLHRMPHRTQKLLHLMACIFHELDLEMLCQITGETREENLQNLLPALKEDLIRFKAKCRIINNTIEINTAERIETLMFQHDHVQQVIYQSIDEEEKKMFHLEIGRFLLKKLKVNKRRDFLFNVLNQINLASD